MKKGIISFIIAFVAVYILLGYLSGFRIKLHAPPMEYFIESIKHMVFFKSGIATFFALLASGIPTLIQRLRK